MRISRRGSIRIREVNQGGAVGGGKNQQSINKYFFYELKTKCDTFIRLLSDSSCLYKESIYLN